MTEGAPTRKRSPMRAALAMYAGFFVLFAIVSMWSFRHLPQKDWRAMGAEDPLKVMLGAERAFYEERQRFSDDLTAIRFSVERGNGYAYFAAPEGRLQRRDDPTIDEQSPAQIIDIDRQRFTTARRFERWSDTGCPLTPVRGSDGRPLGLGVSRDGESWIFVGAAAGSLDSDAVLDCWSIASVDRMSLSGKVIPAGLPYLEQDDLAD